MRHILLTRAPTELRNKREASEQRSRQEYPSELDLHLRMLSQRLYQRLYEEGCADATPPADYNQDMNEAFEQDAASFPAVNAPSLWDSFAAPVSNTNNPGQYDPQHPNSQVAQQFVPPRPAMEVSPSPSFAALPGSSSVELTEEEFRELQHKRLDKYLNSVLQKPEAAIMLDRSQSDQGARFMAVHRPTSSRSLDGNGQTPAVQDWQMQPQRPCTPLQKNGPGKLLNIPEGWVQLS